MNVLLQSLLSAGTIDAKVRRLNAYVRVMKRRNSAVVEGAEELAMTF